MLQTLQTFLEIFYLLNFLKKALQDFKMLSLVQKKVAYRGIKAKRSKKFLVLSNEFIKVELPPWKI